MGKLFNYDNIVFTIINKIVDCLFLSILWILFSIPLVTIGASSAALYYTVNKVIIHSNSYVWKEFVKAFKSNFKQATIVWLLQAAVYYLLITDCRLMYALYKAGSLPVAVFGFFVVLGIVFAMWAFYMLPYISRFQISLKQLLKNCLYLWIRHFFTSVILVSLFAGGVILFVVYPVSGLFLPAGYTVLINGPLEKVFHRYMTEEDLAEEEKKNRKYYN